MMKFFSKPNKVNKETTMYLPGSEYSKLVSEMYVHCRDEYTATDPGKIPNPNNNADLMRWKERFENDGHLSNPARTYGCITSHFDTEDLYAYVSQFFGKNTDQAYLNAKTEAMKANLQDIENHYPDEETNA
jgi:hypothetical protein